MGITVKSFIEVALGLQRPKRLYPVRKDDTFIASFPKSGNTWVRFLVANLLHPGVVSFENIDILIPPVHKHSFYFYLKMRSPRIMKSHEYYDKRYKKAIYIVRDPRDVAVSYWHHRIKFRRIEEDYPIKDFTTDFLDGSVDKFGTWNENVGSWLEAQENHDADILILRYEDLLQKTETEVSKIINYLKINNISDEIVRNAITNSSFEKMSELENIQSKTWGLTQDTRQDMNFVRKGQAGGWKTELPPESAAQITESWRTLMERFGYS